MRAKSNMTMGKSENGGQKRMSEDIISKNREDIEGLIAKVQGVISNRVVLDDEGEIQEVHILGEGRRSPKQIVRDIESAFMAIFGVKLDHKKISIAQLSADTIPEKSTDVKKIKLKNIHVDVSNTRIETRVVLEYGGELFDGSASGPISEKNRMRLAALSTLLAIEALMEEPDIFILEDVGSIKLGKEKVAFSLLTLVESTGEEAFVGSSLIRGSNEEATVRATLDAISPYLFRTARISI